MRISRCQERAALRSFMNSDVGETAYALGDLEPSYWTLSEYWGAYDADRLEGIVLFYFGFAVPSLCLHGSVLAGEAILAEIDLPPEVFCLCPERFKPLIAAHYDMPRIYDLQRMTVTPEEFQASPYELPQDGSKLRRLSATDVEKLNTLYAQAAEPGEEILAFSPAQVELGVFYGVEQGGDLLAAAGTHIASKGENIGAVGNVFTRPGARGRGLASLTTSAVTQALFENGITRLVLNVKVGNLPAQQVYQKLGYQAHSRFIEGPAKRL